MIPKKLEEITLGDIETLVADAVTESRALDYKEALPGTNDDAKKDFLEDVVSFANAGGGDIVFGTREVRDANGRSTGTAEIVGLQGDVNEDAEKLRLDNMIRDGIKPHVPMVQIRFIPGHANGKLCILRISQSWAGPHMLTFKTRPAFFSRNSAGKYPLDVTEIRNAFTLSTSMADRIKDFRSERVGKVVAGETAMVLEKGSKVVLHIVPIQAVKGDIAINLDSLKQQPDRTQPIYIRGGWNTRYNFDGFLSYVDTEQGIGRSYVQVFRDGKFEAVTSTLTRPDMNKRIPFIALEREIIESLGRYLSAMNSLSVMPPVIVMLTLVDVKGHYIDTSNAHSSVAHATAHAIDRDTLLLPDVLVEDLTTSAHTILRPAFDALWNACNYPKCHSYDDQGNWRDMTGRI